MTDPYALASRGDVTVEMAGEHVAVVEIHRAPTTTSMSG